MSERLTISFTDAGRRVQGVAIDALGTLLRLGDELVSAPAAVFTREGERWLLRSDELELTFAPSGAAASLGEGAEVWLCGASGTLRSAPFDGLGLLTSAPAGAGPVLERTLAIPFDAGLAFALHSVRPPAAGGHGDELLAAVAFRGEPLETARFERPRLSSTYDADGELAHVGMELWENEESDRPVRIGGETQAHGVLDHPDGAATHVSFVAWHHDGHHGLGSYAITRAG